MKQQSMGRSLPRINIEGTDFYLDIRLNELREVAAPANIISLDRMETDRLDRCWLAYDLETKNVYAEIIDPDHIPPNVRLVIVPPLIEIDPVGLSRKYGMADDAPGEKKVEHPKIEQERQFKKKLKKGFRHNR